MAQITPLVTTLVQHQFITSLNSLFSLVQHYSLNIFYLVAVIELVIFGLLWALRHEEALSIFILKIIKLAVVFFVITSFPYLLKTLMAGFSGTALHVGKASSFGYILAPAKLWKFGFDASMSLLKQAVSYGTLNVGMSQVYLVLGMGILVLFALIEAQIILIVVAFYVVSILALLLMPLGAFTPLKNFFERAVQQVFCAGARVFALILVVALAANLFKQFNPQAFSSTANLSQPLGLFCLALVLFVLALGLPHFAAKVVGRLNGSVLEGMQGSNVNVSLPPVSTSPVNVISSTASGAAPAVNVTPIGHVQAATTVTHGSASPSISSVSQASTISTKVVQGAGGKGVQKAAQINKKS